MSRDTTKLLAVRLPLLLPLLLAASCCAVRGETWPTASQLAGSKPNILILFADDLGFGDLASYGHPTTQTPNLDLLASQGVRFTQWYSGFHVCSPSRASMMTGRIPPRVGIAGAAWTGGVFNSDAVGGLPANETTVAELLSSAGYRTMAVGKWHLGQTPDHLPTAHGFDTYYGIPYSVDMGTSAWRNETSVDRPALPLLSSKSRGNVDIIEQPTDLNLLSDRYVNASVDFVRKSSASGDPWMLYFAANHVHVPDYASPKFCNSTLRGRFGDALAELDDVIGRILAAVDDVAGDDTLVFFTSDNGPWLVKFEAGGSAGLLRDGKETTWEGGVRVPGIARWTGKIQPGRVEQEVVATYDIFTTAAALAGVPLPQDRIIDGADLSPILFDDYSAERYPRSQPLHDCIFNYKGTPNASCPKQHPNCPGLWAVRCGHYKLHRVTSTTRPKPTGPVFHDPPLIYHIDNDPGENFPLSSTSAEYTSARSVIEAAIADHEARLKPVPNQIAMGKNPDLEVCCDRAKKCVCDPQNLDVFVCGPVGPTAERLTTFSGLPRHVDL